MKEQIFIGPAGWSYPDWKGIFYPSRTRAGFDPLGFVSGIFNLVEINSTFYRLPSRSTCKSWAERVSSNPEFRFTLKALKDFTHEKSPVSDASLAAFKRAIEPLSESGRLGYILFQFPWSFRFNKENVSKIKKLSGSFSELPVAIEVRHGGWADADAMRSLRELGVALCGIDQPRIGNSLGPDKYFPGKAGFYFRLHGRNTAEWFKEDTNRDMRYNYLYSESELMDLVREIKKVIRVDPRVHLVFNNHFRGQAAANSLEIKAMLSGEKLRIPGPLIEVFPRLSRIAESAPPGKGREKSGPGQISLFQDEDHGDRKKNQRGDE